MVFQYLSCITIKKLNRTWLPGLLKVFFCYTRRFTLSLLSYSIYHRINNFYPIMCHELLIPPSLVISLFLRHRPDEIQPLIHFCIPEISFIQAKTSIKNFTLQSLVLHVMFHILIHLCPDIVQSEPTVESWMLMVIIIIITIYITSTSHEYTVYKMHRSTGQ